MSSSSVQPPAVAHVELVVPKGKTSGQSMEVKLPSGTVTIVIPGPNLHGGDRFQFADPATAVSVFGREASLYNANCSCLGCGPYDEEKCCSKSSSSLARWICVASSNYCCCGMLVLYALLMGLMALTIFDINENGGEWPTLSVQGDLDPASIYTLQGWAFDEFKSEAALSLLSAEEEAALDTSDDVQIQQTQSNGGWALYTIFRARGEFGDPTRNLLTRDGLEFMKSIENEIKGGGPTDSDGNAIYPQFEDVCLKTAVNSSLFDFSEVTNETELECGGVTSPLLWYYPTKTNKGTYAMYGHNFYDVAEQADQIPAQVELALQGLLNANLTAVLARNSASPVDLDTLVFDGRGSDLVPCELSESMALELVSAQDEDFECLFDPYTALFSLFASNATSDVNWAAVDALDLSDDIVNSILGPLIEQVVPVPFCSQCYSGSCTCEDDTASVQERVDSASRVMAEASFTKFFFGAEFNSSNLKSAVLYSTWSFGAPLEGFSNEDQGENTSFFGPPGEQTVIFEQYAKSIYPALDAHGLDSDSDIEIIYFWSVALADITLDLLIHDMVLVVGSVLFIFFYMWFHTRSVCLTMMGLVHIFASFPMAFLFYYYIFGIEPFYTLNFLAVYVILAIGADDVFVMVDAWKQFGHLPPSKRMAKAFSRASKAMLITSATTAAAFFATALSPLLDVSTFGLYTACLVISNYVSVITYYIGVIMFFHLYFEYACCCFNRCTTALPKRGCCRCKNKRQQLKMRLEDELYGIHVSKLVESAIESASAPGNDDDSSDESTHAKPQEATAVASAKDIEGGQVTLESSGPGKEGGVRLDQLDEKTPQIAPLERFCGTHFFCVIASSVNRFIFPAILFGFTCGMAYCASQLGPTTQADPFLPKWHPVQRFIDVSSSEFAVSADSQMKTVSVVFGLNPELPMDRSEFSRYELEMGPIQFYEPENGDTCDFGEPDLQTAMYDLCTEFASLSPQGRNENDELEYLVRQGSGLRELEVNCWVLQFKPWYEQTYGLSFPCELPNRTDVFVQFLEEIEATTVLSNEDYDDKVYFDDEGRIIGTSFQVNSTQGYYSVVYTDTKSAFTAWDDWLETNLADHSLDCMRSAMHVAEDRDKAWVFLNTQDLLISGAFVGTGSSLAVALVVLWLATGNIVVAFVATLNMVCVTVCILGVMFLIGWELGTIESVSATVLVGLSVDYVVHIAQAYVESNAIKRADRVRSALFEMGSTVFGGAITSLGASAFLFGCWIQYFFKFGGFMFLTIGFSFLFCFFFFLPLMLICGPERTVEIDGMLYDPASFGCCCKCGGVAKDGRRHSHPETKQEKYQVDDDESRNPSKQQQDKPHETEMVELAEKQEVRRTSMKV